MTNMIVNPTQVGDHRSHPIVIFHLHFQMRVITCGSDGSRVGAAAADAHNVPAPERLDDPGAVARGLVAVAQLAVVPLSPAVHLALHREGQAVLPAGVDGHLQIIEGSS